MNKRQRAILIKFAAVTLFTVIAIVAMIHLRDYINRQEAEVAMTELGNRIKQYRAEHGSVPPESYVTSIKESLPGYVRLGDLRYRGLWIDFESTPDEILAYTEKKSYSLIFRDKFLVLRMKEVLTPDRDVKVEWMDKHKFEALLAQQQSSLEIELLRK